MNKNITPKNAKGQRHGYWEYYFGNDQLLFKCVYINGERNGLQEWYNLDGTLRIKTYYI